MGSELRDRGLGIRSTRSGGGEQEVCCMGVSGVGCWISRRDWHFVYSGKDILDSVLGRTF